MKDLAAFLKNDPFVLTQSEKEKLFIPVIKDMARWHYDHSPEFMNFCKNSGFDPSGDYDFSELIYLPVSIFKKFDFLSVPKEKIVKTLYSSSTNGTPSKIMIDETTRRYQIIALNKILADFFGKEKHRFIIFDTENIIQSRNGELVSRGTAIRGLLSLAKKSSFVLDENLNLDMVALQKSLNEVGAKDKICFFGFTWLLYNIYQKYGESREIRNIFRNFLCKEKILLHIGGWKKLQDLSIGKDIFNHKMEEWINVAKNRIIDIYGITEQLGVVYPDCEYGFKHIPLYSEIIIRDINTLRMVGNGTSGFIQLISPIPQSYPGISLLLEDLGKIVGVDDCLCGRRGKYFVFEKRSEDAELKGCGDVLSVK